MLKAVNRQVFETVNQPTGQHKTAESRDRATGNAGIRRPGRKKRPFPLTGQQEKLGS
jgi:hypothetical protein